MKILIHDRTYALFDVLDNTRVDIDPIKLKLFNEDIFSFTDSTFTLIDSPTRNAKYLTGVLILDDNKSYGRNETRKRLMYKCVPSNKRLPYFLVPYEISIGFHKRQKNKFILFRFKEWNTINNHPIGIITETLGNVDDIQSIYSYQLYTANLNHAMKFFTQETKKICCNYHPHVVGKNNESYTFSIDPKSCMEFDDAFSIKYVNNKYTISVYIADVVSNIDRFNLWEFFTERVSAIYLPDKRLPMIPQSFSQTFCSLQEHHMKPTMRIDFCFNKDGTVIETKDNISFIESFVDKNYVYEEETLLNDYSYKLLLYVSQLIQPSINDSHDLVSFWMIKTNQFCAKYMKACEKGIFRVLQPTDISKNELCGEWNNISSQYQLYRIDGVCDYIHVTSPIRRIVDLLNQIEIKKNKTGFVTPEAQLFMEKWTPKIDFINSSMKLVRKVQLNCELLSYFENVDNDSNKRYEGVVVEKKQCDSSTYSYTVFVSCLKLFSKVSKSALDLEIKQKIIVSFIIFNSENLMCKKVRLKIV